MFCLTYYLQEIKETTKKVKWQQLTTRRRAGRKLPRRSWLWRRAKAKASTEKDVDKQPPTNKWVSIVLVFSTLAFPWLLTLFLLFSLLAFYDAEQISKQSGEGGAMGGSWAQAGGAETRGGKSGFEAGGHNGRDGQLSAGHYGRVRQ